MNRRASNPDFLLLIVTFILVAIGMFMVFDASFARAGQTRGNNFDSYFYVKRQVPAVAFGLFLMWVMGHIPYWKLRRFAILLIPVSVVLLILVFVPGIRAVFAGAHRWIRFPITGVFQCSEVAKIGLILYLAHCGASGKYRVRKWSGLGPRVAVLLLLFVMIVVEPDMGTGLVIMAIGFSMLIASGARARHLGILAGSLVGLVVVGVIMEPYRMGRLIAFTNPAAHYHGSGYQIVHSLLALGSGGLYGNGLGRGIQKLFYLPAGHTDFIFATIGEEGGWVGAVLIILLFWLLVYRGLAIAHKTKDPFGMLLAVGITTMIGMQALLNIAVVTASVPATGVPLPFISYGGSSLVITLIAVGVLVNISKHPDTAPPGEGVKSRDENSLVGRGDGGAYLPGPEYGGGASAAH